MRLCTASSGPPRGVGVQLFNRRTVPLNAPNAYERLRLLSKPPLHVGGLTPLGVPGFAGFFLSLLEEQEGWAVSITPAFAGVRGDLLIVAALADDHVQASGPAAEAAVEVFRQARALVHARRQTQRVIAGSDA